MKSIIITVEIEHTDRKFNSSEIQDFLKGIESPEINFVKSMKKAFKDSLLGKDAQQISVQYAIQDKP